MQSNLLLHRSRQTIMSLGPKLNMKKSKKQDAVNIPHGNLLMNSVFNQLKIDLIELVCRSSYWVSREVFDCVSANNGLEDAPGVFIPYVRRNSPARESKEKNNKSKNGWVEIDKNVVFLDKNQMPAKAIFHSFTGYASPPKNLHGYTCCHIYGGNHTQNWKYFVNLANIFLLPKPLQSITDHDENVKNCLKYISWKKYDWLPVADDNPKEVFSKYFSMTNELSTIKDYEKKYKEELESQRAQIRKKGFTPPF